MTQPTFCICSCCKNIYIQAALSFTRYSLSLSLSIPPHTRQAGFAAGVHVVILSDRTEHKEKAVGNFSSSWCFINFG